MITLEGILDKITIRRHHRVGIAFSGGGARGLSHIGVLLAMEKFGIKPDIISGVSAGSIAAVMYASGMNPLDMRQCFVDYNKFADFREWTVPKDGIFKLTKFAKLLSEWLPVNRLEDLQIPTIVCATNIDRGTQVGWSKGEIVPRVIASCSIPIIFTPVTINGSHYIDGGVLHNLPAWAIRKHCDILYGSNCSPLKQDYKYKDSMIEIALRTYHLSSKANVLQDVRLCDYVITPGDMSGHKTFDLSMIDEAIRLGYDSTCRMLEAIERHGIKKRLL